MRFYLIIHKIHIDKHNKVIYKMINVIKIIFITNKIRNFKNCILNNHNKFKDGIFQKKQ